MYGISDYQGGVAEKRAGGSGNGVEIIPPHSHTPSTKHWPITRKKKGCSGLEHPFYGGNGKTGGHFLFFQVQNTIGHIYGSLTESVPCAMVESVEDPCGGTFWTLLFGACALAPASDTVPCGVFFYTYHIYGIRNSRRHCMGGFICAHSAIHATFLCLSIWNVWGPGKTGGYYFLFLGQKFYKALLQLLTESLIERGTIVSECG